jgi:cysteine dioxygenase
MPPVLAPLLEYLETLQGRPPLEELTLRLDALDIEPEDVAEFIRFSNQGYTRNLVQAGGWYSVLVLCWKNGQRSPIHDHAGSACGLRVLRGTLTETVFDMTPRGHVKAVFSREMFPGSVCSTQDLDLHQVSNLQEDGSDLVTLHVYSPPLTRMGTYSLLDQSRGEELMYVEFGEADGI